jgi:hypothetical protein
MPRLSDLAAERARGRSPVLPVLVSDLGEPFAANLAGAGAWVLPVWGDAKGWNWPPVCGLDVILALRDPGSAWSRDLALAIREARPRRLTVIDWSAPLGERLSPTLPVAA